MTRGARGLSCAHEGMQRDGWREWGCAEARCEKRGRRKSAWRESRPRGVTRGCAGAVEERDGEKERLASEACGGRVQCKDTSRGG